MAYFLEGPNPRAYERGEESVFGEKWAYPNLFPGRLAAELAWAQRYGVRRLEVSDGGPDTIRRLAVELGGQDGLFVILPSGRAVVIPQMIAGAGQTYHTMASDGKDVIAAGEVRVSESGFLTAFNDISGHYRPHRQQVDDLTYAVFVMGGLCGRVDRSET